MLSRAWGAAALASPADVELLLVSSDQCRQLGGCVAGCDVVALRLGWSGLGTLSQAVRAVRGRMFGCMPRGTAALRDHN